LELLEHHGSTRQWSRRIRRCDQLQFSGAADSGKLADVNRDGKLDFVFADWSNGRVGVFLGNGLGGFGSPSYHATVAQPYSVAVADLNGDTQPDIVVTSNNIATASILFGQGDGWFDSRSDLVTGAYPVSIAVGDVNSDGVPIWPRQTKPATRSRCCWGSAARSRPRA
jgi:hypothetical protein